MTIETTSQLALHQARQEQLVNSASYTKDYLITLDPVKDYDHVACPTCGYQAVDYIFIKRGGRYSYCPDCEHIFLGNPLSADRLLSFYAGYPTNTLEWHQNESEFYRRIYLKGLTSIQEVSAGPRILDIGCSSGYFLSIAIENGMEAYGVEPNKLEVEYARQNGAVVLASDVSDLDPGESFDVITLWDVLEHIREPVGYIESLLSIVKPGGCIFVQVPSSGSLAARIMRGACNMFDGVEHLTLFSKRSLNLAFAKAGFELVRFQTVISEVHAIRNFLSYAQDPYLSNVDHPILESFLDPETIESLGLGYKIQAIYRSPK